MAGKKKPSMTKQQKEFENLIKKNTEEKSVKSLITKKMMDEYNKKFDHSDRFLSNELLTWSNQISSSRQNMVDQQLVQTLMLTHTDVPMMGTGYEHEVGRFSKSYYCADRPWRIIHKISRYTKFPNLDYWLIVQDQNGYYDAIHRVPGEVLTESYGYLNQNEVIDSKNPDDLINQGEIIFKSTSFDDAMNYKYGRNARTAYISCLNVAEDAIWAAKEFCDSLEYVKIHTVEAQLNTNEILLNYYGDDSIYKPFPDVGEDTRLNVLCAKRKISQKSIIYSLKDSNLRNILADSDDVYYGKTGSKLIGIEVFCNKDPNEIERTPNNAQVMYYYDEQIKFYQTLRSRLGKIITKNPGRCSDTLIHLFHRAEDLTSRKMILNGNSKFENITIIFTMMHIEHAGIGSKISGRFGEKGVIGSMSNLEDMPKDQYGNPTWLVLSPQGVAGRLNSGQWSEQELTFIDENICRDLKQNNIPSFLGMPKIIEFYATFNPPIAKQLADYFMALPQQDKETLYLQILNENLKFQVPPFWDNVGFDKMREIYHKYPYPRYRCTYKGEKIIKPLIMGWKYVILLKQTPESKYSARSLGMQSAIGHPSKSIKFKRHQLLFSDTPIRIGEMEIMNLCLMNDSQAVADFLKMYANSQVNREEFVKLLLTTDNPFDIQFDVIQEHSLNYRMLSQYLKGIGLKLVK